MDILTLAPIISAVSVGAILVSGYVKASPDEVIIISGLRKKEKYLIGNAGIRIPFLERKDRLTLQLIPIDVKTASAVPTADYINIQLDAAVNVKISDNIDKLKLASQNFLNKDSKYIAGVAREVLEGNMREIVGKMNLSEMVGDRTKFCELVTENAAPDLAAMGLDIISFNVQNFSDANGVIDNLGVDNIVKIQKNAAISRAESEKEIAKAQALAAQESEEAKVASDLAIAEKQNDLAIKKAELKKASDIKQAEADAAYKIQEEEQRRTIEITSAEANIARQEKEIQLKQKEAEVMEQTLDATVKKKAEAELFERQKKAEAELFERQKEAEAELFERQRRAEALKVQAEADLIVKQKEAEGIISVGNAEAKAIQAKGEAEAKALEKKAEAMKKYGQAAMVEMIVNALPEMAREIAKPLESIDKVTIIDSGNGTGGVGSMGDYVPQVLAKTIETVKEVTGLDITDVMKASTYDAKVNRNVNITGLDNADSDIKETVVESLITNELDIFDEDTTV